jgi:outer membrane receptor protein involved in Fe transport
MRRFLPSSRTARLLLRALGVLVWCSPALAADPVTTPPSQPAHAIIPVQALPPLPEAEQPPPPSPLAPTQAPTPVSPATPAPTLGGVSDALGAAAAAAERPNAPIVPQIGTNVVSGGEAQTRNATDVGSLLGKSISDPGVVIQRRNPIVSDPRIRGQHMGQINVNANGAYWVPARLDLDTIVSKIDSSDIQDIIIIKGPYAARYGPGFSFMDIATINSPRYQNGFEAHQRTILTYQTNGTGWNGREAVWAGDADWGVRVGYGIRTAIDYHAGNDQVVPSSYNSQDVNFALGYNFSPNSVVEFKAIHLNQNNLEFPGLYFDINRLTSDAYTIRYYLANQDYFDRFNLDLWYNRTADGGNTQQGAKQVFLNTFLANQPGFLSSLIPGLPTGLGAPTPLSVMTSGPAIRDLSLTNFAEMSRGYRTSLLWGQAGNAQLTVGTDLNSVNQYLNEAIRIAAPPGSVFGPSLISPTVVGPGGPGTATLANENFGVPQSFFMDPGLFAEGVLPIGKRLTLKAGSRGDLFYANSDARAITGNVILFPGTPPGAPGTSFNPNIFSSRPLDPNLNRHIGLWSAYLTGEYAIDNHLTALGGFGYAQRPPTLTELYAAGPFVNLLQQGLTRIIGDPHLLPEKMRQMDLGLRANYGWFRGGANGFYSWVDDYITYNQVTAAVPYNLVAPTLTSVSNGGSSNGLVFTNTPRATLAGGELYGQADVTSWLTPFSTLSYVQARDLTHNVNQQPTLVGSRTGAAQEPLPSIPPLQSYTGVRFHNPGPTAVWNVEISTLMVAGQHLVASSLNELPTPGYTIWNLRGYWQVNQAVLLTSGVENLGNKFYRSHLDPRSGSPTDVLFQPGTNFYFGMQLLY